MKALSLILLLAVAAPVAAQTQVQMTARASAEARTADAALNAQWARTQAAMKLRDRQDRSRGGGFGYAAATLESQRAWLQFRDRQCVIEAAEFAGGSLQPMTRTLCLARMTRERTRQLKDLMWQQ